MFLKYLLIQLFKDVGGEKGRELSRESIGMQNIS